jgi:hypothetical protein
LKLVGLKKEAEVQFEVSYDILLETMAGFFRTRIEPISHAMLLKKTAVFYACLASARRGGRMVKISEILK